VGARPPVSGQTVDELLAAARSRIDRVDPAQLEALHAEGALVVDIRPERQRAAEGELDFAAVVERNVLEWRLDPRSSHVLRDVRGHDQQVIVVCSEGYASSLAAATLRDLGFYRAADLAGGFRAWQAWQRSGLQGSDAS
jgi:rhodanese-related sulfurtransferase